MRRSLEQDFQEQVDDQEDDECRTEEEAHNHDEVSFLTTEAFESSVGSEHA